MANMTTQDNSYRQLMLGNNEFQSVLVSGTGTIKAGTIMAYSNGKYAAAESTDLSGVLAVLPNDTEATSSGVATRVCIAGRVDMNLCLLGGAAASSDALNALRKNGLIPLDVKQLND